MDASGHKGINAMEDCRSVEKLGIDLGTERTLTLGIL